MRIGSLLLLALLLVSFCRAQIINSGTQGNPVVYPTAGTLGPVANVIHSSAFSSPTLQTLLSACPASPTPCYVVLDPSATAILIPAATTIGSNTQQVIVEDEGAVLNCTGTTGADCIDLSSNGSLNCIKKGITSNSSGCQLTNSSSSNTPRKPHHQHEPMTERPAAPSSNSQDFRSTRTTVRRSRRRACGSWQ